VLVWKPCRPPQSGPECGAQASGGWGSPARHWTGEGSEGPDAGLVWGGGAGAALRACRRRREGAPRSERPVARTAARALRSEPCARHAGAALADSLAPASSASSPARHGGHSARVWRAAARVGCAKQRPARGGTGPAEARLLGLSFRSAGLPARVRPGDCISVRASAIVFCLEQCFEGGHEGAAWGRARRAAGGEATQRVQGAATRPKASPTDGQTMTGGGCGRGPVRHRTHAGG